MNLELFQKIAAKIRTSPREFSMGSFENQTACGTTRCIAGWAIVLSGGSLKFCGPTVDVACDILGISKEEGISLFFIQNWPDEKREEYWEMEESGDGGAEIAAEMIEQFVSEKEREMTPDQAKYLLISCKYAVAVLKQNKVYPDDLPLIQKQLERAIAIAEGKEEI